MCTRRWRTNPIHNCRVRVQLGVQDHLVFKLTSRLHMTSILDVLHLHKKLTRQSFQWHRYHVQLKSESSAIIKRVLISRTIFGATPPFWPNGSCIQLQSIRDASYGSATTLDHLYSVAAIILHGFCLD
jgi:hypothetical protein